MASHGGPWGWGGWAIWGRDTRGILKPNWLDTAVEEARKEARRSGRHSHCPNREPRERS